MPAVFAEWQGVRTCSLANNRAKLPMFHSFVAVFSGLEWRSPPYHGLPYTAPAALRRCSSKSLVIDALPKASAQNTPSVPRPTLVAADCCGLAAPFVDQERTSFFPCTLGCLLRPPCIMLSALSASVLAISRLPTPSTDEGNTETVPVCCLCKFGRGKKPVADSPRRNRSLAFYLKTKS